MKTRTRRKNKMLYKDSKTPDIAYHRHRLIVIVGYGAKLIWEYIRSCFSKGYWINTFPWVNDDGWKNEY